MNPRTRARLLRLYPPSWRARYGEELEALILASRADGGGGWRGTIDVAGAGLRERLRSWGLSGDGPSEQRTRSALLAILSSWALIVLGGGALQRFSEHWEATTPASARALPSAAFGVLVIAGALGCALIATGILIALPGLGRLWRAGGLTTVRRPLAAAAAVTVAAAAATGCLVLWAHQLDSAQRNGGDLAYSLAFLAWAALAAATLLSWTGAAVACGRRISLSETVMRVEAGLGVAVAVAAITATTAACVWWAALATDAPWVLHGSITGSGGSALAAPMLLAAALMALGSVIAATGARVCAKRLPRSTGD